MLLFRLWAIKAKLDGLNRQLLAAASLSATNNQPIAGPVVQPPIRNSPPVVGNARTSTVTTSNSVSLQPTLMLRPVSGHPSTLVKRGPVVQPAIPRGPVVQPAIPRDPVVQPAIPGPVARTATVTSSTGVSLPRNQLLRLVRPPVPEQPSSSVHRIQGIKREFAAPTGAAGPTPPAKKKASSSEIIDLT
jgi:hypothetical protein